MAAAPASGLPSASSLISQAWGYYRAHFKRLLGITLVSWVVIVVVSFIAGALGFAGTKLAGPSPTMWVGVVVYVLVILIVGCWQYVALIYSLTPEGETKPWREAYTNSKQWLWPYLLVAIISGILTAIGFVLLIIPGILILTWFSFASFIVVNENLKPIAALKASRNYTRGRFGAIFWRWLIFILVMIGASIVFGIIGNILGDPGKSIVNFIFSLLATPFTAVYGYRFYQAVRQSPTPAA
jgi:hypothetical protein